MNENQNVSSATTNAPRKPMISREDFILTWEKSSTVKEVADKLDRKIESILSRAYQLRGAGIPIKKMANGKVNRRKINLNDSLTILAKIRGVSIETLKEEGDTMKKEKKQEAIT